VLQLIPAAAASAITTVLRTGPRADNSPRSQSMARSRLDGARGRGSRAGHR